MFTKKLQRCFCYCGLGLASVVQGCASVAKQTDPEQVASIEVGRSTKDDVLRVLGLPNKREVKTFEDRQPVEFWVYYEQGGKRSVSFSFPVGPPVEGPKRSYVRVYSAQLPAEEDADIAGIIAFDKEGRVVDVKVERNEL